MDSLLAEVAERCRHATTSDTPKYRRLMAAIEDTIKSGTVAPGDRLPTEKAIASALPFALGTVQKALNGLVAQGLLHRHRRSGTFVANTARPLDDMSQFVFERADGTGVGDVLTEITDIAITHDNGHWSGLLGDCPAGYIRISRIDQIDRVFFCYVELHLRADRYSELLSETPASLSGKNIRTILETRYDVVVDSLQITASVSQPPERVAKALHVSECPAVLQANVAGYVGGARAVFSQTTFAPASPYQMKFRTDIR